MTMLMSSVNFQRKEPDRERAEDDIVRQCLAIVVRINAQVRTRAGDTRGRRWFALAARSLRSSRVPKASAPSHGV